VSRAIIGETLGQKDPYINQNRATLIGSAATALVSWSEGVCGVTLKQS
jgi:hypothetical protein